MPFSCFLYPAVGSSCTQLLGSIVPSGWVAPYPAAGYERTYSLGTIRVIRWVQNQLQIHCLSASNLPLNKLLVYIDKAHSSSLNGEKIYTSP